MANHHGFNHQIWRTAIIAIALGACLIFGITVLSTGDWLPGGIIVAASSVGLAREVAVIRKLQYRTLPTKAQVGQVGESSRGHPAARSSPSPSPRVGVLA